MVASADESAGTGAELLAAVMERVEAHDRTRERPAPPPTEADFDDRYEHLVHELRDLLGVIEEVERHALGRLGIRFSLAEADREVRITSLEDQERVHFVFGHPALGRRAEHHASRPFGDRTPDVLKLAEQVLAFLITGTEPRWAIHRTARSSRPHQRVEEDPVLELPLD